MNRLLLFERDEGSKRWLALAAVSLDAKPGPHDLLLGNGQPHAVRVAADAYRTGRLTVPPKFVSPPRAVLTRIAEEREIKKAAFATPLDTPQT